MLLIPMQEIEVSSFHENIFDEIKNPKQPIIIQARAGSGKSTLCRTAVSFHSKERTCMLMFNTKNAKDMSNKIKESGIESVTVRTYHSVGYAALFSAFGDIKVTNTRMAKILDKHPASAKLFPFQRTEILNFISFVRNYARINPKMIGILAQRTGMRIKFDGYTNSKVMMNEVIEIVFECIKTSASPPENGEIDTEDMVYLPYILNLKLPKYDRVYVDEAQDSSSVNRYMAIECASKSKQLVIVGDDMQAIYAWRGADKNSMTNFQKESNAIIFPLPVSYRCSKAVASYVSRHFVPDFTAHTSNKLGSVSSIDYDEMLEIADENDMILSRTNSMLVRAVFRLFMKGKAARIERGRENAAEDFGLKYILNKYTDTSTKTMLSKVKRWTDLQISSLEKDDAYAKASDIKEQFNLIMFLAENTIFVSEILKKIDWLVELSKSETGIVVSSIHRAKGAEANNVFVLENSFSSKDSSDESRNLKYVAYTRAIENLYMVYGTGEKK